MGLPRTVRQAGDLGLLVELGDNAEVHALAAAVRRRWGDALEDVVPGHATLLVTWRPGRAALADDAAQLETLALEDLGSERPATLLRVPVRYDGPDLDEVAAAARVDPAEIAKIHSTPTYIAAFIGFAPGFAYLIGGDRRLAVPRRAQPRVRVEAGSVAVAAGYTAIYPSEGPGGWQIIGHTDLRPFDPTGDEPPLIAPGMHVVFEAA